MPCSARSRILWRVNRGGPEPLQPQVLAGPDRWKCGGLRSRDWRGVKPCQQPDATPNGPSVKPQSQTSTETVNTPRSVGTSSIDSKLNLARASRDPNSTSSCKQSENVIRPKGIRNRVIPRKLPVNPTLSYQPFPFKSTIRSASKLPLRR